MQLSLCGVLVPQDCNLVLYTAAGTTASDAIYYTATYGQGIQPCALSVSSSGGGFITVADANHTVLYLAPTGFGVLIDTGFDFSNSTSPSFYREQNAVYTIATAAVSQAPNNLNQTNPGDRTLLPTIGAVLSVGYDSAHPSDATASEAELYSGAAGTWAETGQLHEQRSAWPPGDPLQRQRSADRRVWQRQCKLPDLLAEDPFVHRNRFACYSAHSSRHSPAKQRQSTGCGRERRPRLSRQRRAVR